MGGSSLSFPFVNIFPSRPGEAVSLSHPISTVSGWFLHLSGESDTRGPLSRGHAFIPTERGMFMEIERHVYI